MNPEPFTLQEGIGPSYKKPDALAFRPPSKAAQARQAIHGILQKDISVAWSLEELQKATSLKRILVYNCCRTLCLKGFATRHDEMEVDVNPKKPEASARKRVIRIQGVDLMRHLKRGSW